jgi:hypothetical protein
MPQRESGSRGMILSRFEPGTVPGGDAREAFDMSDNTDRTFPYVLVGSTLGAIISLASVWIITAQFALGLTA